MIVKQTRLSGQASPRRRAHCRLRHPAAHRPHRQPAAATTRTTCCQTRRSRKRSSALSWLTATNPWTAEQISQILNERWAMSAYPRNLSTPRHHTVSWKTAPIIASYPSRSPTRTRRHSPRNAGDGHISKIGLAGSATCLCSAGRPGRRWFLKWQLRFGTSDR